MWNFGTFEYFYKGIVSSLSPGSSQHPDLRGPSVPSSPSFTPNTPTMLCSGNSESNLNTPLNINLNSSLNSNYHTLFSSSTGLSKRFGFFSFLSLRIFSEKFRDIFTSHVMVSNSSISTCLVFSRFSIVFIKRKCLWNLHLLKCRGATEQWNSQQHANADWTAPRRQVAMSTSVHEANIYLGDVKQRSLTSLPSQAAGSMTAKQEWWLECALSYSCTKLSWSFISRKNRGIVLTGKIKDALDVGYVGLSRAESVWVNYLEGFFCFSASPSDSHISNGFLLSPQVQPQALHSLTIQSPPPSHPVPAHGVMNAPSAMRMQWTRSSTPVGTCVSATPAVSNSRRWRTRAAPFAGGQSKISSRPTGARRLDRRCQVQLGTLSKPCETL